MLSYVLYTIYIIACIILILVVLLQPGKGDVASALGGGTTGAAFGPRGATTLLAKVTIVAAISFMTLAFLFGVPGVVTTRSVISGVDQAPVPVAPATPVEPGAPVQNGGAIPAGTLELKNGQLEGKAPGETAPAPEGENKAPAAQPAAPENTKQP